MEYKDGITSNKVLEKDTQRIGSLIQLTQGIGKHIRGGIGTIKVKVDH